MSTKIVGNWAKVLMDQQISEEQLADLRSECDEPVVTKHERDWCSHSEMCERLNVPRLSLRSGIVERRQSIFYRLAEGYTWETARTAMALAVNADAETAQQPKSV